MFFKNAQIKFVISWSCHLKSYNLRGMALEGMAWFVSIATAPVWYCVWQQTLSLSHSALCAPQHGSYPISPYSDPRLTCFEQHLQSLTVPDNEAGHCPGLAWPLHLGPFSMAL